MISRFIPNKTPEARAILKTTGVIVACAVGIPLWVILMIWLDNTAHLKPPGELGCVVGIFGLPALALVGFIVYFIYGIFLDGERKKRGYR